MKNLTTAIYSLVSGSGAFWTSIGGRFYKRVAPTGPVYPYVVYSIIYDDEDGTFQEEIEDCLCQVSIFSSDNSSTEVENLYTAAKGVLDKCNLSITGNTHLHMLRQHATLFEDELENPNGTGWVWHYAIDYNIKMQKN